MANKANKNTQNVDGKFYVDDQCIACDACVVEAPAFFCMNDVEGYAFVCKQPISPSEVNLCNQALELCPVAAIGND